MKEALVYNLACRIYSTFGRNEPSVSSGVVRALSANVKEIPDRIAEYIYDRICQQDNLPQNLTRAFRGAWETYRMENPNAVYRETCPSCGGTGGWDAWEPDGKGWHHFFAVCPACGPKKEGRVWRDPRQLRSRGCLVRPTSVGMIDFMRSNNLTPPGDGSIARSFREVRAKMGVRSVPGAATEDGIRYDDMEAF